MKRQSSATWRLDAMALEIPRLKDGGEHPNRVPFSGVLTLLDAPSDRPPAGAAGHRVVLPRGVAERALPSLLGMAVDYAPGLRGHDVRRKIGIITRTEIVGPEGSGRLEVGGYLFGKDFPEVIRELRAQRERLGMSYEVANVRVADPAAKVWVLAQVVFTGAAILERSAAAYSTTSLAATTAHLEASEQGDTMNEKIFETLDVLAQTTQSLTAELASLRASVEEVRQSQTHLSKLLEVQASARPATEIETRVDELARLAEELRRQNEALRAGGALLRAGEPQDRAAAGADAAFEGGCGRRRDGREREGGRGRARQSPRRPAHRAAHRCEVAVGPRGRH